MNNETIMAKEDKEVHPNVYIKGSAGVLHVRSSEILRSRQGKRQLDALSKVKTKKKEHEEA